jgi:hypothetical protein
MSIRGQLMAIRAHHSTQRTQRTRRETGFTYQQDLTQDKICDMMRSRSS